MQFFIKIQVLLLIIYLLKVEDIQTQPNFQRYDENQLKKHVQFME